MKQIKIPNFHDAKRSLVQSFVRELLCRPQKNALSGLRAQNIVMQAANFAITNDPAMAPNVAALGAPVDCIKLLVEYLEDLFSGHWVKAAEVRSEYKDSGCDVAWIEAAWQWFLYYKLMAKSPQYNNWRQLGDFVYPLPSDNTLRIGLIADWGTGEQAAQDVMDQMMAAKTRPDLVIHLGDIYYSGTTGEDQDNFITPINNARLKHGQFPVVNLPGNHDYYSGGEAFYAALPNLNPYQGAGSLGWTQEASYFCLRNTKWQIQGMDTGYNDNNLLNVATDITHLQPTEVKWHQDKISSAGARKIIFLSHHQLYSAFTNIGNNPHKQNSWNPFLKEAFADPLAKGRITAWFWGHEHLLGIYGDDPGLLTKGRCIGYSGFPVFVDDEPYTVENKDIPLHLKTPGDPNSFIKLDTMDLVYDHGYGLLTLGGDGTGKMEYYQVIGFGSESKSQLVYTEAL